MIRSSTFPVAVIVLSASIAEARQSTPATWVELGGSATGSGLSIAPGLSLRPSMALLPSGYPVIAWSQYTGAGYQIYVRRWDGFAWVEMVGSASGSGISAGVGGQAPDLAIDPSGNPVVAWQNGEIYVRRWNGSAWEELGGSGSGAGISATFGIPDYNPRIAIDGDGNPWVVWQSNLDVYLRRWNDSDWVGVGGSASAGGINNTSQSAESPCIALDSSGNPIVAWSQYMGQVDLGGASVSNHDIYVRRWNGSAWIEIGGSASGLGISNSSPGSGLSPRIAVDAAGNPAVAWREEVTDGAEEVWLRRWSGTSWEELDGSGTGGGISGTSTFSREVDVKVDPDGSPVLAWSEGSGIFPYEIHVRRWDGSTWAGLEGSASGGGISAAPDDSSFPSLAISPRGSLLVAWNETVNGEREIWMRGRFVARIAAVRQLRSDGTAVSPMGDTISGSVVFEGEVSSSVYSNPLRLEIEARPVGVAFTGTSTHQGDFVAGGTLATLEVSELSSGPCHWRARAATDTGVVSEWFSFGNNAETEVDFIFEPAPVPPPAPPPPAPQGDGGGGNSGGCGLLGFEAVAVYLMVRAGVRRFRARRRAGLS